MVSCTCGVVSPKQKVSTTLSFPVEVGLQPAALLLSWEEQEILLSSRHPASQYLAPPLTMLLKQNELKQVSKQGHGSYYVSTGGKCINKGSAASLIQAQVHECHSNLDLL